MPEDNGEQENKILIIDDDDQITEMLKRIFEFKGLKSLTCATADEALSILRSNDIKLILLDIHMPEITGVELLKRIQEITPSVNVIMMTGYRELDIAQECMELGAKDYITKPFDLEYLETTVLSQIIPLL